MAAMMNMTNLLNGKDSRWLQLEVCREFQRNKCSRPDTECKFAHPPANVEVQNGRVTACYDSIKGRCNREKPPCKYFHPPQHLKDQLLINGRNHLALKNAIMQQMGISPGQPVLTGQVPTVATNPYLTGMPASTYSPYFPPGHLMPTLLGPADPSTVSQLGPVVQQAVVPATQQKIPRSDRLEAFPGVVPFKRTAADKSGIPVYQPGATTYQQLMQLQQPFVPVSCEYPTPSTTATSATYIPQTSTATLIANNSSSISSQSINLTSGSYYTSSGNSVNNNNNNNKINNKNTALVKSLSLQSVSSLGAGLSHLANGQMHSDSDLSVKAELQLSDKEDTSAAEANTTSLLTTSVTTTSSSLPQTLIPATSATQSVCAPITSLSYSAAHLNSYTAAAANMQAHAAQAAAVAQANQAAVASAQYTAHYTEAANLAKEVAQKNYANALKMAAVSNVLTGKPLTALSYTGVTLNKSGLLQQTPSYATAAAVAASAAAAGATGVVTPSVAPAYPPPRIGTPAVAAPQQTLLPALTRPPPPILQPTAFTQMLRPQIPTNLVANNPYAAAAAVAQHQLMNQSLLYPTFQPGGYQFANPMHTAIPTANLTAIPGAIPQVQQVAANPAPGSAVVLNPYKKMKTS